MEIEQAIRAKLIATSGVSTLVGSKVYAQEAPQDQGPPYVVFSTGGYAQEQTLSGMLNLYSQTWRWECYGGPATGGYRSAKSIAAAIRGVIFGGLTVLAEVTTGAGVDFMGAEDQGGDDEIELPIDAEGRGVDYVTVQARIWWRIHGDDGAGL